MNNYGIEFTPTKIKFCLEIYVMFAHTWLMCGQTFIIFSLTLRIAFFSFSSYQPCLKSAGCASYNIF